MVRCFSLFHHLPMPLENIHLKLCRRYWGLKIYAPTLLQGLAVICRSWSGLLWSLLHFSLNRPLSLDLLKQEGPGEFLFCLDLAAGGLGTGRGTSSTECCILHGLTGLLLYPTKSVRWEQHCRSINGAFSRLLPPLKEETETNDPHTTEHEQHRFY